MKCPYCGSNNTQGTNVGERVFANLVGFGAGIFGSLFGGPGQGGAVATKVSSNVCEYAKYICLNCKKEFLERR